MKYKKQVVVALIISAVIVFTQCQKDKPPHHGEQNPAVVEDGKNIFRFDSFGDEAFWSDLLHIDKAIKGQANGGFGPGVSPKTALAVGLKVDAEALPANIVAGIQSGAVDLNDPKTTIALLKLNAVLGVKGNFSGDGALTSVGITCASCHSTVDNSLHPVLASAWMDGPTETSMWAPSFH